MKSIFKTWIKIEPNNTTKIKEYIDELLTNNNLKTIDEFEEEIYNQAAIRLYRNKVVPSKAKNLLKANIPRLLELTSNVPEYLIEEVIKKNNRQKGLRRRKHRKNDIRTNPRLHKHKKSIKL